MSQAGTKRLEISAGTAPSLQVRPPWHSQVAASKHVLSLHSGDLRMQAAP